MSKSILIRVTNDEGYDDVAPELMMEDVIGNPSGGWVFELVQESDLPNAIWLAKFCHDAYERLAPQYGYETRQDTRTFDHESPNGRLMAAVFEELRATLLPSQSPHRANL
jgi:hypothetical protein